MIETVCAKFRKQNHPNNTLLLTWAAFLSQKHLIYLDLIRIYINNIYRYIRNINGPKPWRQKSGQSISKKVIFGWFCSRNFAQAVFIMWGGVPMYSFTQKNKKQQKMTIQAGRPKKRFLFGHFFFNITNVFCAKKWVGHACICPRMVTG